LKQRINITLDSYILEKIDLYAEENFITRSAAITKLIMECKVKGQCQVKGQLNLKDLGGNE